MRRSLALHVHPQEVRITNLRIHSFIKIDQRVFEALEYRQMFFIIRISILLCKKKRLTYEPSALPGTWLYWLTF